MKLLAVDPSSKCVGYAVMTGMEPGELVDGGCLTPSVDRGLLPAYPNWLGVQAHLQGVELMHWRRIMSLGVELMRVIDEAKPDAIVIEIPSGKFGTGAKHGGRGSLTTYGLAAGMLSGICRRHGVPVIPVTERQWTAGQGNKRKRQAVIAAYYRRYVCNKDPGADVADAIGLGRWWLCKRTNRDYD